ncbi:hypothetical protein FGO68_gene7061 [Halteria grandinella]|uniref:Uncharacterized protein n=1 Tax=Halteria grandinella TaxID=5974 RepID=A0A8J8NMR6_HALGN|nr:hypothetical protein FGO68_gene7061 [Halteria grandinella]
MPRIRLSTKRGSFQGQWKSLKSSYLQTCNQRYILMIRRKSSTMKTMYLKDNNSDTEYFEKDPPPLQCLTKDELEDAIRRYDFKALIDHEEKFQWLQARYQKYRRFIMSLTSIVVLQPEIFSFKFTQNDLRTLTDESLDKFLALRINYKDQLMRSNTPSLQLNLMQDFIRMIDQEKIQRYQVKQKETISGLLAQIKTLQKIA